MIFEECLDGDIDSHWVYIPMCQKPRCERLFGEYPHNSHGRLDMEEGAQDWPDDDHMTSYSTYGRTEITRKYHAFVHPTHEQIAKAAVEDEVDNNGVRTQVRRNRCPSWRPTRNPYTEDDTHCECRCHWGKYYVNAYAVDRWYGGPEEGGWYYDTGQPVESVLFESWAEAEAYRDGEAAKKFPRTGDRYSVRGGDDFTVWIEQTFAASWPTETPRYE